MLVATAVLLLIATGFFSVIIFYVHLMIIVLSNCWRRLTLMTLGVWTEELLTKYKVLSRTSNAVDETSERTTPGLKTAVAACARPTLMIAALL